MNYNVVMIVFFFCEGFNDIYVYFIFIGRVRLELKNKDKKI